MGPIIIKLVGAVVGAVVGDVISKKLTTTNNGSTKEIPAAKIGPESNDTQNIKSTGSSGSGKRLDRSSTDKPDEPTENEELNHEPDQ